MKKILIVLLIVIPGCKKQSGPSPDSTGLIISKKETPVLSRQNGLVSDPSVVRFNGRLVMIYTDYSLSTDSVTFNAATSDDGIDWEPISTEDGFRVFSGDPDSWDTLIETPELTVINDSLYMYYIGYPESNFDNGIYESEIGLAKGTDINNLVRHQQPPVLPRGGTFDKDGITSPGVVFFQNMYHMIYTGWSDILTASGFLGLTGATSPDGASWTKNEISIFPEVSQTTFESATESDLVQGPDGVFYLFFSAEGGIAVARSNSPFGPWEIYPEMIITSEFDWESGEVVAPDVIFEGGKAKIWYAGVVGSFNGSSIGYAEIEFPFNWD